ncbi:Uma2 family endonuclease [Fibrella forsythiae]|uniref:Uma2 family endonuclease n=1 Tax=Fibrella forsythiae TaxID=2817061 RepID=A0ABS3JJ52_9BACT|nr:Uma2 family endonuclease [Fibrella forsythiae]MBO0950032.1 Uma2 family endonuclease [Fibrella forsythiae]
MITTEEPAQILAPAVPAQLIRETLNGRPLYYKGYRDVLAGRAKPQEIMGGSDLQSVLVTAIVATLWSRVDRKRYKLASSEAGLHMGQGNNFAANIAIFDKATLPALKGKYFDVPPKVMIEVDIRIEWDGPTDSVNYLLEKSQKLFEFGVERVLWVLTTSRKIVVMQAGQDSIITDWSNDVLVLEDCTLNIKNLLDEEEIVY